MSREKTISLAQAQADFNAVLRLARRFDFVKVMSGTRLVGVFTSGRRWNKTGWLAEIEPLPPGTMERIYSKRGREDEVTAEFAKEQLTRLKQSLKPKPAKGKVSK